MKRPRIRRELRPGDLGRIIAHHGRVYSADNDVDSRFEAHVAKSVAEAGIRGFPRDDEALWIVEVQGEHAGSLALTREPDGSGMVRWFVFDRELRGQGLGRRLLGELVDFALETGYDRLSLETFSELRAAARLYREHGFEIVRQEIGPRWGREEITYQRYEATFQRLAQERNSRSAGVRERPFSVSA